MSHEHPTLVDVESAAQDVCAFVMIALEERFLRWEKTVNLQIAQGVWNAPFGPAGARDRGPPYAGFRSVDPHLGALFRALEDARAERWRGAAFRVDDLDAEARGSALFLLFDLSWPGVETVYPCEMEVVFRSSPDAPRPADARPASGTVPR